MRDLLVAPLLQALDFKLQSRILAVDRAQNFPIVQRIAERSLLFVQVRAGNDGIHQIALVLHQPQRALEMRFAGMLIERLAQNIDALVQIGLGLDLPVDRSDEGRQFLPLLLLDVVSEGLKNRVVRILGQIGPGRPSWPWGNCVPRGSCAPRRMRCSSRRARSALRCRSSGNWRRSRD